MTATPTAPPPIDLAAILANRRIPAGVSIDDVVFDAAASTAWTQCYRVPSQSEPGSWRKVAWDVREKSWRCSCPATVPCWHINLSQLAARVWWWRQVWRGYRRDILDLQERLYADLLAGDEADEDDLIAYGSLGDVLGELEAA